MYSRDTPSELKYTGYTKMKPVNSSKAWNANLAAIFEAKFEDGFSEFLNRTFETEVESNYLRMSRTK